MGPFCPCGFVAGALGGAMGGYFFGIYPPQEKKAKIRNMMLGSALTGFTFFVLKRFFNVPLCQGASSLVGKVVVVVGKALVLGTCYAIGINYLFPGPKKTLSCCCKV